MKLFLSLILFQLINLQYLFATHKPGHSQGKNKAPEIDDYSLLAIIVVFICFYIIYLYQQKIKRKDSEKIDD
ncbi:MAG: hypothetical protein COA79_15805 [Planctomycetota bacterium]|nr:MAG: hypothetical protein COA79_15805 [Planctomycetota bacterium]